MQMTPFADKTRQDHSRQSSQAMRACIAASLLAALMASSLAEGSSAQMQMSSGSGGQSDEHPPPLWPYHLVAVALGFFFLTAGAITAMYRKKKREWLKPHKMLGLSGMAATLAGVAIAIYMVLTYLGTLLLDEVHAYLGLCVLLAVLVTPTLGYAQFRIRDKRMHAIHRWSGRLTLTLMAANLLVGIAMIAGIIQ